MGNQVNALEIANSPIIWFLSAIVVLAVICQTVLFLRLAFKTAKAKKVDLSKKQCMTGFRAGAISAIGPSLSVFVVMIGLVSILGGPMAWLRVSVIGGATTELTAAKIGITSAGGDIAKAIDLTQLSSAWWTMAINSCGWLIVTAVFAKRMEKVRNKIGGGDPRWLELFSSAATLGIFGAFVSEYVVTGIQAMDYKMIVCIISASIAMWFCLIGAKKFKWLNEYALGISMFAGILSTMII